MVKSHKGWGEKTNCAGFLPKATNFYEVLRALVKALHSLGKEYLEDQGSYESDFCCSVALGKILI